MHYTLKFEAVMRGDVYVHSAMTRALLDEVVPNHTTNGNEALVHFALANNLLAP